MVLGCLVCSGEPLLKKEIGQFIFMGEVKLAIKQYSLYTVMDIQYQFYFCVFLKTISIYIPYHYGIFFRTDYWEMHFWYLHSAVDFEK